MKKAIFALICIITICSTIVFAQINEESSSKVVDSRPEIINNYFRERNMPLEGYGQKMVDVADTYGLDWRLLPAISIRETSGGKYLCKNIKAQNNPFGWGSCKIGFKSFNEAIDTVGYKLSNLKVYKDKSTEQKLYYYNGTVVKSYPSEVLAIMNTIK